MAKAAATRRNLSLVLCLFVILSCLGSKLPAKVVSLCYTFTVGQTGPGLWRQEVRGKVNKETFVYCSNNTCHANGILGRKLNTTKIWQPQIGVLQQGSGLFKMLVLHMMQERTLGEHLLLNARMCCWHEADGQFNASWNFDINERKMLHLNTITGAWTTIDPASVPLLERIKRNLEVTTFLQMTSQNHCKTWFQEFSSHLAKKVKRTGSSKAMTIKPHISVLLILLTCSLLLLLSGGSLAMAEARGFHPTDKDKNMNKEMAQGAKVTDKMVPPVQVSPLIKLGRYSALVLGMAYGAKRYSYLKPRAEEERRVAAEEKKRLDELKRIERERAEAQDDSILK